MASPSGGVFVRDLPVLLVVLKYLMLTYCLFLRSFTSLFTSAFVLPLLTYDVFFSLPVPRCSGP